MFHLIIWHIYESLHHLLTLYPDKSFPNRKQGFKRNWICIHLFACTTNTLKTWSYKGSPESKKKKKNLHRKQKEKEQTYSCSLCWSGRLIKMFLRGCQGFLFACLQSQMAAACMSQWQLVLLFSLNMILVFSMNPCQTLVFIRSLHKGFLISLDTPEIIFQGSLNSVKSGICLWFIPLGKFILHFAKQTVQRRC